MNTKWKLIFQIISLLIILTVISACGTNASEQIPEAVSPTIASEDVVELSDDDEILSEQEEVEETQEEVGETNVDVSPIPTEDIKRLEIVKYAWFQEFSQVYSQDFSSLYYTFLIENPNEDHTFINAKYQVDAYDEDNNVLETKTGFLTQVSPGQTLGVSDSLSVDVENIISRIEVQISEVNPGPARPGESVGASILGAIENIEISNAVYHGATDYRQAYASAIITNPNEVGLNSLKFSIVLIDSSGEIVGGGLNYHPFINPTGTAYISSLFLNLYENIEDKEITPVFYLERFSDNQLNVPDNATGITIIDTGFRHLGDIFGYGFILNNPNNNYAVTELEYQVTLYSPENIAFYTIISSSFIMTPNQTFGIGGFIFGGFYGPSEIIDRIDVQVKQGRYIESEVLPFFESENIEISYPNVTGTINNPIPKDVTLEVYAILRDENGEIIGGGNGIANILANSTSDVEIWVSSSGVPAYAEIYATLMDWTTFRD